MPIAPGAIAPPFIIGEEGGGGAFNFGNALNMDGLNDYIQLDSDVVTADNGTFVYSAWFRKPNFSSIDIIFGSSTSSSHWISFDSDTDIRINSSPTKHFTVAAISVDVWHHLLVSKILGNGSFKVWVDGIESTSGTQGISSGERAIGRIGTRSVGTNFFEGDVDEILLKDGTIGTDDTATALYNSGDGVLSSDVIESPDVFYRLNESTGTNAPDTSGNNNDGTLINFADPDSNWIEH